MRKPLLVRKRNADGSLGEFKKVFDGETEEEKIDKLESELLMLQEYLIDKEMAELMKEGGI